MQPKNEKAIQIHKYYSDPYIDSFRVQMCDLKEYFFKIKRLDENMKK